MTPSQQLLDNLSFNRDALSQLLVVSALLGGFGMSGLIALVLHDGRGRLRATLVVCMCIATLAFIFATTFGGLVLAGMQRASALQDAERIVGFLRLGQAAVRAMMVGSLFLVAGIGGVGFVHSRRMGFATLALAALTTLLFVLYAFRLAALLR